ncbi:MULTISPECIES: ATP-dependent DNA helicase [unclassified Leifsonia]|uniref:ATP-dependent DNA helicase n=1 Tax=unclassified Leifsonia TaxID=2663824 RepID=UPI0009E9D9FE|nr:MULTISPECIES: ATP-dependent DNA helicase [unclassified Leifsonia]
MTDVTLDGLGDEFAPVHPAGLEIAPDDLARRVGDAFSPTAEQSAVIRADLSPTLVIAGAGSGKTETMANRVIWLLATGRVRPEQVLGLTFTRKAAGELAERIQRRIGRLDESGLLPRSGAIGATASDAGANSLFDRPTVSTYNAFANSIFHDNAVILGREPESQLLSESSAWLLARRVTVEHGDDRLVRIGKRVDDVTDAVLRLSRALAENEADASEVRRFGQEFRRLAELPYNEKTGAAKQYADVTTALAHVESLDVLLDLAARFDAEKRRLGLVEFSDQVALARAACERSPRVVDGYRDRYKVILLDEYQDTSVGQTRLLSTLFAGQGVMAVGDPHQSIYGWRGASADNLSRFASDFVTDGSGAETLSLSTSWRNPTVVLDAANRLVEPLTAVTTVGVATLSPRPDAPTGVLTASFSEQMVDEADAVAEWFSARLDPSLPEGDRPTAAMLFRARRHMEFFAEALRRRGIPCHVLGIGGLLSTPEVVDLVATLRVVHDPAAGSSLLRLLSGALFRIGPRDLAELARVAAWLQSRDWQQKDVGDEVRRALRESVAVDDAASIVDALDFVSTAPAEHRQLTGFSDLGLYRLRGAGARLAFLRSRVGLALPDFVRLVEQELRLDIEVSANERNERGMANLYAFHDEVAAFVAADERGTLGSFLAWLDRAEKADDLGPRSDPGERGVVQLLTIHGSKGLEWDFVVVPGMTEAGLPSAPREGGGWVSFGQLPYEFRGDRLELPVLPWRGVATQQQFRDEFVAFKAALAERSALEERRLAYVAVTRAREQLLLTGSFWADGVRPKQPSRYLRELAEVGIIAELPDAPENEENPSDRADRTGEWPFDPLGTRRGRVEQAADAVRSAARERSRSLVHPATPWSRDIDLLLAERSRRAQPEPVALPARIPASRFKDYVDRPGEVAEGLRRPLPQRPYRATRLGTLFHSWVEHRSAGVGSFDLLYVSADESDADTIVDAVDATPENDRLAHLQATFERSEWADRAPEDVEIEIHLALAGQVFICKLDAVYRTETGYQVVDWKTGRAPTDARDLELKQTQLALYRLAYARWKGVDPSTVDAVFYFVADDVVVRPERLYEEEDLLALWSSVSSEARREPDRASRPASKAAVASGSSSDAASDASASSSIENSSIGPVSESS